MTTEQLLTRNLTITEATRKESDGDNVVLEFPFSSEEPYVRHGFFTEPWIEVLGHNADEVDLSRMAKGAPVLLNHGASSTSATGLRSIGITTGATVSGKRGMVEIKLSRRDDMAPILRDLEDGLIPNVSVGYRILKTKLVKQNEDGPDEYRVTRWLPMEVTLCDVPADATVGIGRSINIEDEDMGTKTEVKEPDTTVVEGKEVKAEVITEATRSVDTEPTPQVVDTDGVRDAAVKAERKRTQDINTLVRSVNLDETVAEKMVVDGVDIEAARKEVIDLLAKRTAETPTSSRADIDVVVDETETRREMMANAIMHRYDPKTELSEGARQYRSLSLLEMTRENMRARGVSDRGLDRMQLAGRAFEGTSDLPNVLADVANKSLRQGYEVATRSFTTWARQTSASDFKNINRMVLSDTPDLEVVNENGEFKRGTVTDGKETYKLATVGKVIGLTRQAIINDDLDAFTRIPAMFAVSAAAYESDTVYGILTANDVLSDGVALFQAATHGNLTSTGTAISVASLSAARLLMRKQKTIKKKPMNLRPAHLIVPAALETVAAQFMSSQYVAEQPGNINPLAGSMQITVESRLDDDSATAWYVAADNGVIDTVEYAYLEGNNGVYIETRQGFDTDGMEIKARLDFAAKAIDHRGLYKNNGA